MLVYVIIFCAAGIYIREFSFFLVLESLTSRLIEYTKKTNKIVRYPLPKDIGLNTTVTYHSVVSLLELSQLTTEIDKLEIEFSDLDELTALINQRYTAWKDEGESGKSQCSHITYAYELKAILKFHAEIEQRGVKLTARLTTLRQKFTTKY
ncbi:hypothetical protein MJO28_013075 [Puccinia striiformis f. sp. tritici]|uniref:Uncharacterized protein n=1 Tax=Puccinia striiformis f. sp. tritici TaxID=168172 RepID=A0ACC0DYD5_9BASI|nr:hypothetical protein MJO28_013075 [Puccinia striiformis f. sp. tritici]KAI7943155.1 hypothetical protein MJO29_012999 [Puccinia striiformis f. sp. tritici]